MTPPGNDETRVLVVEDEPNIADVIAMALRHAELTPTVAGSGREALRLARDTGPHLMLLDVMLPDLDGFEVAARMRDERLDTPIIFLTARDTTEDKVRGLTLGGDDYVTKPFSVEELLARVNSILRRTGAGRRSTVLRLADLELDEETREVNRAGRPIDLTDTEFRLLRFLLANPRRALTRSQILDHVWDYDFAGDARVLETYISYLRKKVDAEGPPLIHTIRGVGYALKLPRS